MKKQLVRDFVQNLDSEVGSINLSVITLEDIDSLLGRLRIKMDNFDEEELRLYFREFHLEVRVLDELVRNVVKELKRDYYKVNEIKDNLFEHIVTVNLQETKERAAVNIP